MITRTISIGKSRFSLGHKYQKEMQNTIVDLKVRVVEGQRKRKTAKIFIRKTVKPPEISAETVFTFFRALHIPLRFSAADDCLVIIFYDFQCLKIAGKGENQ